MPVQVQKQEIPAGDAGTRITVARMAQLIRDGAWAPVVRQTALRIVAGVNGRDGHAQALAIRAWLKAHWHFVRDPADVELLHTPVHLLTTAGPVGIIQADCDDAAILGAALARSVGLEARIVVVAFHGVLAPSPFRHVFAEAAAPSGPDKGKFVELDVTRSAQQLPWESISRVWIVPVTSAATTPNLFLGVLLAWVLFFGLRKVKTTA